MNQPVKFRKKPVVIEAMQLEHTEESGNALVNWLIDNDYPWLHDTSGYMDNNVPRASKCIYVHSYSNDLTIRTLEGDMAVSIGDFVIKGVQGEFYACKPDIFEATYELAEDTE